MRPDEVKMKICNFAKRTVDAYIPQSNIIEKLKNGTIKLWIDQNLYKLEPIMCAFTDENGDIDVHYIANYYKNIIFENGEFRVDIKSIIPEQYSTIKDFLPNKIILFHESDLDSIFS